MQEVNQTWFFNQQPGEVWEYLTQPELVEQWLMKCDIQPVVGNKFKFYHIPKNESRYVGIVDCEVLEVTPVTRLSYSWNASAKDGSGTFNSTVLWTLTEKESGTELQLNHNGFAFMEDYTLHNTGWTKCLTKLTERLNMVTDDSTKA